MNKNEFIHFALSVGGLEISFTKLLSDSPCIKY